MALSTNHQCPNCTGPLRFDPKTTKLVCDYCDSKFEVSEIDDAYDEKIKAAADKGMESSWDEQAKAEFENINSYKTYTCSSCGAELFCDEVTVATSCPYCGNPNVIAGKFHGGVMPDCVIPFKFEKKDAIKKLAEFYKGKKLLPKVFSKENHIEEIKGVYVPFWLYSGAANINIECTAERVSVQTTSKERIERISHYAITRAGLVPFNDVPVDASKKMDNAMMDSLEPFDYKEIKPFTPSYLPGFFAEAYDETAEECRSRLETRVKKSAEQQMLNDIHGYTAVQIIKSALAYNMPTRPKYALFPVWLLSTKWRDQNYLFAMNGQTGKMVGKLPVDWGKFFRILGMITGIAAVVLTPILYYIFMKEGL